MQELSADDFFIQQEKTTGTPVVLTKRMNRILFLKRLQGIA
jgi:hypothetical protein